MGPLPGFDIPEGMALKLNQAVCGTNLPSRAAAFGTRMCKWSWNRWDTLAQVAPRPTMRTSFTSGVVFIIIVYVDDVQRHQVHRRHSRRPIT